MKNLKNILSELKETYYSGSKRYSRDDMGYSQKRSFKQKELEFELGHETGKRSHSKDSKMVKYKPGDEKKWKEESDRLQDEADEKRIIELLRLYGETLDQYRKLIGPLAKKNRLLKIYDKNPKKYNKLAFKR